MLAEKFEAIYQRAHTDRVFCPYRVCPLGAHVDHQQGLVTGFALDRGVELVYIPTDDGSVRMQSVNYGGDLRCSVSDKNMEKEASWGDFVRGAIVGLSRKYKLKAGLVGLIEGTLPVGGISSSAAVILTYLEALCNVNDIHLTQQDLISQALWVERHFIGVNVGKLDQSCEVYSKKDHLLFLDTQDDTIELVAQNPAMPPFEIAIVFSGRERMLAGSAYNARVDECKAAAYALRAYAGAESGKFEDAVLRDVPEGVFDAFATQLPRPWHKRAKHFFSENERVKLGVQAWRKGDLHAFGKLVTASGESSIHLYETGSEELCALHEIMAETDGIYGARFSGAGFNGCSMALVDPGKREAVAEVVSEKYLAMFPSLRGKFSIHFCQTADGIALY